MNKYQIFVQKQFFSLIQVKNFFFNNDITVTGQIQKKELLHKLYFWHDNQIKETYKTYIGNNFKYLRFRSLTLIVKNIYLCDVILKLFVIFLFSPSSAYN